MFAALDGSPFLASFFHSPSIIRDIICMQLYTSNDVAKKRAVCLWVGHFFSVSFFCFCYSTIPSPRTKNQKETHRKGATTTIFWCRHFLAEDNADRENDNERASGVHNIIGLVRGGRVSGWEMEERCRVVCRAAAAAKQINGF
jgi:hypothetical protein